MKKEFGDPIPKPDSAQAPTGLFRLRVPRSLHAKLAAVAEQEGVSLNTLVVALIAEGLGKRKQAGQRPKPRKKRAARS